MCFEEDFNKEQEIEQRLLNPNKITHGKEFVEIFEELLNAMPIECDSGCIDRHKDRAKMEKIDQDMTFVLQKVRSKAEVGRK